VYCTFSSMEHQEPAHIIEDGSNCQDLASRLELVSDNLAVKLSDLADPTYRVLVADAVQVVRLCALGELGFRENFESGYSAWNRPRRDPGNQKGLFRAKSRTHFA